MMDAPFECRQRQDYFELGCCMYEFITKEKASLQNENFKQFYESLNK